MTEGGLMTEDTAPQEEEIEVELVGFTDERHPTFSQMIIDYISAHPDTHMVVEFLGRLGVEEEMARNYLAYLNGTDVVVSAGDDVSIGSL